MLGLIILLTTCAVAPALATNVAGNPTDLANWPPCAQRCIPEGFGPPADCGSLSNLTCICDQGIFSHQIQPCESLGCNAAELNDIATLSDKLCAPVGGFGTSLLATLSQFATSTETSLTVTPSIPPTATSGGPVVSVLATETLAPNLGNPAELSTYPECAQICNNETIVVADRTGLGVGDTSILQNACSATFRSLTAGCEAATCDDTDYEKTQLLAQQLCGSLYANNTTLSSSVSAAVTSATAAAKAATDGKDPTVLTNLPVCAQNCIKQINFGGCGSLSNLECVCQGVAFNNEVGPCEVANCSQADLTAVVFLAEKLCAPVGGVLTHPVNYTNSSSGNSTSPPSPTLSPFTGVGSQPGKGFWTLGLGGVALIVGLLML